MSLCLACGMCCDGTLFGFVPLTVDEADAAGKLRLTVVAGKEGPRLRHPCSALQGLACTVYEERPGVCRTFECGMLRAHRAGSLSQGEALDRIARVREAVRAAEEDLRRMSPAAAADPFQRSAWASLQLYTSGLRDLIEPRK